MTDELDGLARLTGFLRSLVASGQPLPEGLAALARTLEPGRERVLLEEVGRDLANGTALSAALSARLGGRAPALLTGLVRAGEASGQLGACVDALAGYYATQRDLARQVHAALLYPRMVVLVMVAVVLPALAWVQGQLLTGEATPGLAISPLTRLVDTVLAVVLWPFSQGPALGAVVVVATALVLSGRVPAVNRLMTRLTGRLLAAGAVRRANLAASLARGLSLLLAAGVPAPEALRLLVAGSADADAAAQLTTAAQRTEAGLPLGQALAALPALPSSFAWFLPPDGAGLEQGLAEAARFYEDEARDRAQLFAQAVEPAALLVLAVAFLPGAAVLARILALSGMGGLR